MPKKTSVKSKSSKKRAPAGAAMNIKVARKSTSEKIENSATKFSPYNTTANYAYKGMTEDQLFATYLELWDNDPLARFATEFLLHMIFSVGYHFEGAGADAINQFWSEHEMHRKIVGATRDKIRLGNGYLIPGKTTGDNPINTFLWVDGASIKIEKDDKGAVKYTQPANENAADTPILGVAHYKGLETQTSLYGRSYYRAVLPYMQAIHDICMDIPIAIKRIAYAALVMMADLTDYVTEEEKVSALEVARKDLQRVQSAGANFAIDNKNRIEIVGQGASTAKLLPTNQLVEPLITEILLNFYIPLGMYLQTGSNKALLQQQRQMSDEAVKEIRAEIMMETDGKVLPGITNDPVRMVFNEPLADLERKASIYVPLVTAGIMAADEARKLLGLDVSVEYKTNPPDAKELDTSLTTPVEEAPNQA